MRGRPAGRPPAAQRGGARRDRRDRIRLPGTGGRARRSRRTARRLMRGKTAGGAGVRPGRQRLTAKRATVGMSRLGQPCVSLHISFLSRERVVTIPDRSPAARKGGYTAVEPSLILWTGQPSFIPNKRPYTSFSDRTGDNVDKSTVLRKNFHSPGTSQEKTGPLGCPASRREPKRPIVGNASGDWHGYCIERVIGGIETGFPVFSGWDSPASPVTTSSGK